MLKTLALLAAMTAGQAADTLTTCRALHSGRFAESNGLLPQTCSGIAVVKGVSLAGASGLVVSLQKHHPRAAKFVAISWAVVGATSATINLRRMK